MESKENLVIIVDSRGWLAFAKGVAMWAIILTLLVVGSVFGSLILQIMGTGLFFISLAHKVKVLDDKRYTISEAREFLNELEAE